VTITTGGGTTTTRGATITTGGGTTTTTRGATTIRFAIGTQAGGDGIAGAIALGGAGGKSGRKEQLAR
jgi:hypothetical protein